MISLSARERMAMVQSGYNPLLEEDVNSFRNGQKPVVGTSHLIEGNGEFSFNSLGERNQAALERQCYDPEMKAALQDPNIRGMIEQEDPGFNQLFLEGNNEIDNNNFNQTNNPREEIQSAMNQYQAPVSDLNSKLKNAIQNKTQQNNIQNPVNTEQVIKIGYNAGAKYLNAFQQLLKNPNENNRNILFQQITNMLEQEDKYKNTKNYIHFQNGLAKAESKLCELLYKRK